MSRELQPQLLYEALYRHRVEYVLIGGLAAILHGAPTITNDADITPRATHENLERLAAALRGLHARIRASADPEGLPFACDAEFFAQTAMVNMVTDAGQFDVSMTPSGTGGYDDLIERAVTFDIDGVRVPVAALADIIHSKETANRAKDHAVLPILYALEDEIAARE